MDYYMAKGILEFDLPNEADSYESYLDSPKKTVAIQEYDNYLREVSKYGQDPIKAKYAQEFRDKLYELFEERDIPIWDH